jgi:glutathione S-transferase
MIELYTVSGSPYSWRVILTAEVKGVPYQPHVLQLSKGEHRSPEYLKMNPRGREPLLKDGDFVVTESLAMMIYLDRLSEKNPLFGTDTKSTVRVFEGLSQVLFDCEKATLLLAEPTLYRSANADPSEAIRKAGEKLRGELKIMDERLGRQPWLVGEAISAADVAALPLIMTIARAAGKDVAKDLDLGLIPLDTHFPHVAAWVKRMEALPGYERAFPAHWREG